MYTKFFGLKKRPFLLSPDPEFLFLSRAHDLAFTHLEYGLLHHAGFVALTGDVGTGKTILLKYLFDKVKTSLDIAMIFNTQLDSRALLEMLLREFDLTSPSSSKAALVDALCQHFIKQYSKGERCVIVIDEAQNLPLESFEELRMLSNLEVGSDVLVQIILVGQPQLRDRLSLPSLAQLTQRISVHYHLCPLSHDEVGDYVAHRLRVAGYEGPDPLFTEEAVARITEMSRGFPRVINLMCDSSLTYAFADELPQVSKEIVERVVADNELLLTVFRSDVPKVTLESTLTSPQSAATALAPAPADYQPLLSQLTGRLEAIEIRMRMLESDSQHGAIAVLQEMLEKERERSSRYAQQVDWLATVCRQLHLQLTELQEQMNQIEDKSHLVDHKEAQKAADTTYSPELPHEADVPPFSWWGRYKSVIALLLVGTAFLAFSYQAGWLSWRVLDHSVRQSGSSGALEKSERRSEIAPGETARRDSSTGEHRWPVPQENQTRPEIPKAEPNIQQETDKGTQKSEHRTEIAPGETTQGDSSTGERSWPVPQENQTRPEIPKAEPNTQQEADKGAQAGQATTRVAEMPAAGKTSAVLPPSGEKVDSGTGGAPEVSAVQPREAKDNERSAQTESGPSSPSDSRLTSTFPSRSQGEDDKALTSKEILLHRLEIKASQPCWVQVRTDNKKTENVLLQPGEKRAWVADQEVEVVLGNAGGVEMQWDYKPVTLGGRPGQVLRLKLPQSDLTGKSP